VSGGDGVKDRTKLILLNFQVVARLEVDPEALARPEVLREAERRVSGDPTLPVNDLIDPTRRNAD